MILKNDPSGSIVSHRSSSRKRINEPIDEEELSNNEEDGKKSEKTPEAVPKIASKIKSIADTLKENHQDTDDGSENENLDEEDPNTLFTFHGNRKQFSIRSLYFLRYDNWLR